MHKLLGLLFLSCSLIQTIYSMEWEKKIYLDPEAYSAIQQMCTQELNNQGRKSPNFKLETFKDPAYDHFIQQLTNNLKPADKNSSGIIITRQTPQHVSARRPIARRNAAVRPPSYKQARAMYENEKALLRLMKRMLKEKEQEIEQLLDLMD